MESSSWIPLVDEAQLNEIFNSEDPLIIFKHSTRCQISSMALNRFVKEWNLDTQSCKCFLLDLIRYRELSNAIAKRSGIVHESPQILLLKEGRVIYTASHHEIDAEVIRAKLT
jgi:bacillithiol system protein YtxJ